MTKLTKITLAAVATVAVLGGTAAAAAPSPADGGSPPGAPYGYADFYDIPSLGYETVSGSGCRAAGVGCGGDGSLGDVVPDGYWRGYVSNVGAGYAVEFDPVCVYRGTVDPNLVATWRQQNPGQPEPWVTDGFLVSTSSRRRTVYLADNAVLHGTEWDANGGCAFDQPNVPFDSSRDAWIRVVNGDAQWAVSSCAGPASGEPAPAPHPAPHPAPNPGTGFTFPYGAFWDVPQLGSEAVHGTGCGGNGSLGDTMPDGLWYGWITSTDSSSLQFDVGCMYVGATAEHLWQEFQVANPDYGSPPNWPGVGFLVNNNERTRTVPIAASYVAADAVERDNGDGSWSCVAPADPSVTISMNDGMGVWLSIQNGQAQYSLQECTHD